MLGTLRGGAALLALALAGCGWIAGDVWDHRQQELDAAGARWLAAGIEDYSYVVRRSCECMHTAPVRISVVRDEIVIRAEQLEALPVF